MIEIDVRSEDEAQTERMPYHSPELVDYGTVVELVQASPIGPTPDSGGTIVFFITT